MKRTTIKVKTVTLLLSAIMILSMIPTSVFSSAGYIVFTAENAAGKIFEKGNNKSITTKRAFDTSLSELKLRRESNDYILSFKLDNEEFVITSDIVAPRMNNVNNDHYLLAPRGFSHPKYSLLNIEFTTNANDYDLIPANSDLKGKAVLSIIMESKVSKDIYYWQTEIKNYQESRGSLSVIDTDDARFRANEYYYMKNGMSDARVTENSVSSDDYKDVKLASRETYETLKNAEVTRDETTVHNAFYDIGILDGVFKKVTNKWEWLQVRCIPGTDTLLPLMYYAYSYSRYGDSEHVFTHIMVIGHFDEMPTSYTTVTSNGKTFCKATAMINIEVYRTPHTVRYSTITGRFGLLEGGENLTQIPEPSVRIRKNSSNIKQVLCGRFSFSNATKKNWLGGLVLKSVVVELLDKVTYGITSTALDIVDVIGQSNMSVSANDGYVPIEEYSPDYTYQINQYGEAMGSIKHKVKGYLRTKGQYLGTRAWFAVPYADRASATKLKWVYYVSIEMR